MNEIYRELLDLKTATFIRIEHEEGIVAVVYKVTIGGAKPLILKISDRPFDHHRELYFLNRFAGKLPVPKVIKVCEPRKGVHGAILMECIPGDLLKSEEISGDLAFELGRSLAIIHQERFLGYGDPMQEALKNDPRSYFIFKFKEGLEECAGHLPVDLLDRCWSRFEKDVDLLLDVDGPCVVHRDYRPGNIMVKEGKLQGIIDWAGARASFAEEDFCASEWPTPFKEGYKTVRPLPNYERIMPLLRLSKAIATIGYTCKKGMLGAKVAQSNLEFLKKL